MKLSKWLKYLSQLLSAAVFAFCAAAGMGHTVPALEVMDWPAAIGAAPMAVDNEEDRQEDIADKKEGPEPKAEEGCSDEKAIQASGPEGTLNDGTYYGTGEGYGGIIKVKVVVSGGKISSIDIVEADGETPDFLAKAKGIIPTMLSQQSANVDAVSGATLSSNGIKTAVADALSQAGSKETVPVPSPSAENNNSSDRGTRSAASYEKPSSGWKDGTYVGSASGYGGTVTVNVTISGGKIRSITASGPGETPSYWQNAQAVIPRIVSSQDPRVDAVSGATYSSNGIINAVIAALGQAGNAAGPAPSAAAEKKEQIIETGKSSYSVKVGDPGFSLGAKAKTVLSFRSSDTSVVKVSKKGEVTIVGEGAAKIKITARADGTYKKAEKTVAVTVSSADSQMKTGKATVQPDGSGQFSAYEISLTVTFRNGKPVAIGRPDSNTDPVNQSYLDDAFNGMQGALLKVSDVSKVGTVDVVSGATCSSRALREAYQDALSKVGSARKDQTLKGVASGYDLTVDQHITLKVKGNQGKLSFSTDKKSVAKVDSSGKVTAVGAGRAVVTVTAAKTGSYNEAKKTVVINVVGKQQTITMPDHTDGSKLEFTTEDVGKTISLQADASGGAGLTYQSSKADVAAVSNDGVITLVGKGTAIITITAGETSSYQSATVRFTIMIKEPDAPVDPPGVTGTFSGSAEGYGGTVTANVVLDNGVITGITVEGAKETRSYWLKAKTLIQTMISDQTWDVDAVTGATYSSDGIRNAVKNALEAAGMTDDGTSGG